MAGISLHKNCQGTPNWCEYWRDYWHQTRANPGGATDAMPRG